jgi:hypothetical protein
MESIKLKNNMAKKLTYEQQKFLDRHFNYEFKMLSYSYGKLVEHNNINGTLEYSVYLECFLLHSRNLQYFFLSERKKYKDDAIVLDFIDKENWEIIKGQCSKRCENIAEELEKINKHVTHLTYSRPNVDNENKIWYFTPIFNFFNCLVKDFNKFLILNNLT